MPQEFGRYQLLDLIGKGGMAEVYRARLQVPAGAEKQLVIKRILPSFSSDPEFLRLFVNEAKITLPLSHGNITTVFDFGEVGGEYFLAMEYIHGQNLATILERCRETGRPPPISAVLFVAAEVAKGLAYAHGATSPGRPEIVHLDVSPQNILVSYDGAVKLTDFGIARARASAATTERRVVRGKASYLAPEQVEGGALDGRTDIYALGCVLYEMLTGVKAQEGATDEEVLANLRVAAVPPPSTLQRELSGLDPLLARMLARDPADRFPGGAELQAALTQALYARAPGYGALELSEWMRDLFAWELAQEQGETGVGDRLLFQLSRASARPEGGTTGELELPTRPLVPEERGRRWPALVAAALALATVVAVGAYSNVRPGPAPPVAVPAPPPPTAPGQLSLNSWPSSVVYVDGQRLPGTTPHIRVPIAAGAHQLRFVHAESESEKLLDVNVPPGGERAVVVNLAR